MHPAARWLLDPTHGTTGAELLAELAQELRRGGIPVSRGRMSVRTKHPEIWVHALSWSPERGGEVSVRRHELLETPEYLESPVYAIHRGAGTIRCRLVGPHADLTYPACREFAEEGGT